MKKAYQVITFIGNTFLLKVQGLPQVHTWDGGTSETGDKRRSRSWWEGQVRLYNSTTPVSENIVFNFETRQCNDIESHDSIPLEKEFLRIIGLSEIATIPDMKPIVDDFCRELIARYVLEEDQTDALPVVCIDKIPVLNGVDYVEKGLIIEPGHQMQI